jgi:DNA-damage-inducible protein D
VKALKARDNLRDSMTPLELALTILSETTATELHRANDSYGVGELSDDARQAGEVGGAARRDVEARLGRPVVSSEKVKTLAARPERQASLFSPQGESEMRVKETE